jgi:hypothetical protein
MARQARLKESGFMAKILWGELSGFPALWLWKSDRESGAGGEGQEFALPGWED